MSPSSPGSLIDRVVGVCFSLLVAAVMLVVAVKLVAAVWLLIVAIIIGVSVIALAVVLLRRRTRGW